MRPYTRVGGTPVAVAGTPGTPMPPGIVGVVGRFMGHSWRSGALGAAATASIRGHNGCHVPIVAAFQVWVLWAASGGTVATAAASIRCHNGRHMLFAVKFGCGGRLRGAQLAQPQRSGALEAGGGRSSEHKGPRWPCLLYTSPSPRDQRGSRMPSSA